MGSSKMMCLHVVGYNPYSAEQLDSGDYKCLDDDPANIRYNYCPWCGERVDTIIQKWIKMDEEEDDCMKGGCAD